MPEVPTGMLAAEGYADGAWDVTPPDVVSGTDTETFTFTFEKKDTSDDEPPKTGDRTDLFTLLLTVFLSGGALAALLLMKKRSAAV